MKFFDRDLSDAVVSATGDVTPTLIGIAQGNTESTRNGRKCTIRSIHWRFEVNLAERDAVDDPASGDTVRIMLYQDKQANGATAAVTDILEAATYLNFRNLSNGGRFNIILDKLVVLNYLTLASDAAAKVSQARVRRDYVFNKVCSIPIEYNSNAGAIGEIRSNNLGLLLISANGLAGLTSKFRFRFSDGSA